MKALRGVGSELRDSGCNKGRLGGGGGQKYPCTSLVPSELPLPRPSLLVPLTCLNCLGGEEQGACEGFAFVPCTGDIK